MMMMMMITCRNSCWGERKEEDRIRTEREKRKKESKRKKKGEQIERFYS